MLQVVLWDISQWSERLKSHRQAQGQTKKNTMNSLVSILTRS